MLDLLAVEKEELGRQFAEYSTRSKEFSEGLVGLENLAKSFRNGAK